MRKVFAAFMISAIFFGFINAASMDVPEKVKALLLKTGASW